MPTYTMELWRAIEYSPGGDIGLGVYPIWDEGYRNTLNEKIINHYHNREIGVETIDMFKFAMKRRMAEIMPFYNDLYNSTKLEFDPLSTVDLKTVSEGSSNTQASGSSDSTTDTENKSNSRAVNSSTPQVQLSGRGDYATSAADTNAGSTAKGTGTENSSSTADESSQNESRVSGYQGIASDLLMRYRESLINIDLMIIGELTDLFMMVWNNSDSYTPYDGIQLDSL